jgi:methylated-DNA-protein-cysteine methyltransferase related protein
MDHYRQQVYDLLRTIPKGKVTTYGRIAKKLSMPTPRLVGKILHMNTNPESYPCHRVVFSDGSLAKGYVFGGEGKQREILEREGILFTENKVHLTAHLHTWS